MNYNVETFVTNKAGQYVASVAATYDNFDSAKVRYHQILATYHNADDVEMAAVKVVDEYGNPMDGFREIVDHRPEPDPEPEPDEPEDTEPEEP